MADIFDPKAHIKKRLAEETPVEGQGFDPKAHIKKRLSESTPESIDMTGEAQSFTEATGNAQRNPFVRKLAEGRLAERQNPDETEADIVSKMNHYRANRMDMVPSEDSTFFSPNERKLSDDELRAKVKGPNIGNDIGNFLYGIADFKKPFSKDGEPSKNLLAQGIGSAQALFPSTAPDVDPSLPFDRRRQINRDVEQEVSDLRKNQSPAAYSTGRIGGDVLAYSNIMKSLAAIPGMASSGGISGALKNIVKGSVAGGVTGQLSGNKLKDIPSDMALGAGGELVGELVPGVINQGKKALEYIKKLNDKGALARSVTESIDRVPVIGWNRKAVRKADAEAAKNAFDANQRVVENKLTDLGDLADQRLLNAQNDYSYNKTAARNQLRDLSRTDAEELGQRFTQGVGKSKKALSDQYGAAADDLMSAVGDQKTSVDVLRSKINDVLNESDVLTSGGKVDQSAIDLIQSPERKSMVQRLLNISESLDKPISSRRLNSLKQDLQSLANFNSPIKTAEQGLFGRLSDVAKNELDNTLSKADGPLSEKFKAARAEYAKQKPTLDYLAKKANVLPERLVVNARVQFPKSKVNKILSTNPEFKPIIGDYIFEHITQTPATQNTIRKTMDYYGRDFLEKVLGKDRFNSLAKAEESLTNASKKFSLKDFKDDGLQSALGEIAGKESVGPYSVKSVKGMLKNQLEEPFNFKNKDLEQLQEKLNKLLGKSKGFTKKTRGPLNQALSEFAPAYMIGNNN